MARTTTEIQADIDALVAARSAIIAGERVTEFSRDGRRLTYQLMSLADAQIVLASLRREMEQAEALECGRQGRRPIRLGWTN